MTSKDIVSITAILLEEDQTLSLAEVCRACDVSANRLLAMIEEGLLEPRGSAPERWALPATQLRRVQVAVRLERDLGVNLAGAGLALDLLEEVRVLRARVRALERRFGEQD